MTLEFLIITFAKHQQSLSILTRYYCNHIAGFQFSVTFVLQFIKITNCKTFYLKYHSRFNLLKVQSLNVI